MKVLRIEVYFLLSFRLAISKKNILISEHSEIHQQSRAWHWFMVDVLNNFKKLADGQEWKEQDFKKGLFHIQYDKSLFSICP